MKFSIGMKMHYSRTLINGCREEVYAIHGVTRAEAEKMGPQVGDVDEKSGLRVVSRDLSDCKFGNTHRRNKALPPDGGDAALKAQLKKVRPARPDRRRAALRLKVWYQAENFAAVRKPWKDRVPKATPEASI